MMNENILLHTGTNTQPIKGQLERELVQRACRGDADAFGQLYDSCLNRVYRYIYFRVSDDDTAEDLTSKVFLKAWEHLPRFKSGTSPFIAWLYTIAHNMVVDHYRVTRPSVELDEARNLPAGDPLPDAQYELRSDVQALRRALDKLTREQRDVVTMKLLDGMSTDEIAARMRKSPGAVRALQMRGLQALAKIYRAEA
jgi:RNA polymerase sigma-70 factor (ECF subfamily)